MYSLIIIVFLVKFGKSIRARLTHKNDVINNMNNNVTNSRNSMIRSS
jgi:hypothetical protein